MEKTALLVGAWGHCDRVATAALSGGWSLLHTPQVGDVPVALKTGLAVIVLAGPGMQAVWPRATAEAWAVRPGVPVLALDLAEELDWVVTALFGVPAISGAACPVSRTRITPTLTLYRPVVQPPSADIRRALDFVAAHYGEPISLADVAAAASYSRSHFCKVFKGQLGVSFVRYLSEVRVRHAARLLAESALSVTDIAFAVGFQDLSHFERVFRTLHRQSPSRFRQGSRPKSAISDE